MADITDYISGGILNKFDILSGRPSAVNVMVFVEGEDDVPIWEQILSNFPKYKFTVSVNRSYKVNGNYPSGKAALMQIKGLSKEKIVCVDADLDLVVNNYSLFSKRLRNASYVFNTQYYSIENVLSQPELLKEVVKVVTGVNTPFNFDLFMKYFSNAVSELFLLYLSCIKEKRQRKFSLEDIKHEINEIEGLVALSVVDFRQLKSEWHSTFRSILVKHEKVLDSYRMSLKQMGYKERDTYKLLQGHCLYNCVVKQLLVSICGKIFERKMCYEIKNKKNPNHFDIKQKVYSPIRPYGSLTKCVDYYFYNNKSIKNYVPAKLYCDLARIYI